MYSNMKMLVITGDIQALEPRMVISVIRESAAEQVLHQ